MGILAFPRGTQVGTSLPPSNQDHFTDPLLPTALGLQFWLPDSSFLSRNPLRDEERVEALLSPVELRKH